MPHIPLGASTDFQGASAYGPYGDAIEEIDWSCGAILEKLQSLEIDRHTLVVFTSDNSPWIETTHSMKPEGKPFIPRDHSGSADPLRGYKMSAWEGGSRVPCIVRWPGQIDGGRISDEILTTMDLLPTFTRLAGGMRPEATDFLRGNTEESPRDEYLYYAGCLLTGVRVGDWKLVLPRPSNPPGTGWWGRMIEAIPEPQLYHLPNDPGEEHDIADRHPDVVARLMTRIERARTVLGDIDQTGSGVRLFDEGPRRLQAALKKQTPRREPGKTVPYDNAPPVGDLRFTFEDGDWQGWRVVEGDLAESLTDRRDLPNHQDRPFNKQGNWFLFTGHQPERAPGNDALTGILESPRFMLRGTKMRFLVGGGSQSTTYVALVDADGNEQIRAHGTNGPVLQRVDWDVSSFQGQTVSLRIVDHSRGGWGHVTFDDFSCDGELSAAD